MLQYRCQLHLRRCGETETDRVAPYRASNVNMRLPNVCILRDCDQVAIVLSLVFALMLMASGCLWTGVSWADRVEYEAAPHRPVQFLVDLNQATWAELSQLPAIGETRARQIVESRERAGEFQTLNDLRRVPGVGRGTLAQIRNHLMISRPARSSAAVRAELSATLP